MAARVRFPVASLARCAAAAGLALGCGSLWPAEGVMALVKLTVLSGAAGALLLALGEFQPGEIRIARSLLIRRPAAGET